MEEKGNTESFTYSIPKKDSLQSLTVILKDLYDNQISTKICSIDNTKTEINQTKKESPVVKVKKTPLFVSKNERCTIMWDIKNIPEGSSCFLIGEGLTQEISLKSGNSTDKWVSNPLISNQKYTVSCSGGDLIKSVTDYAICRMNVVVSEE